MKPHVDERPPQKIAEDLRDRLLGYIQRHFYADLPKERFWADRRLLLRWVVLWPAKWLSDKGVTMTPERYEEIMVGGGRPRGILVDAATLGQPPYNPVKYLATVVQKHWEIHGEGYYEEAKALRNKLDPIMRVLSGRAIQAQPDPIATLANASDLLRSPRKRRQAVKPPEQMDLLS